jgi:type I restriction enzyme M protein
MMGGLTMRRRVPENDISLFNIEPEPEIGIPADCRTPLPEHDAPSCDVEDETSAQVSAIQRQLNELHEEIYKKGGVKPVNAAIDEMGKLIFMKIHLERRPDHILQEGSARGKRLADLFTPSHVLLDGRQAIGELQDAFAELANSPEYRIAVDGVMQTLFPPRETLRLDNSSVLAMAIRILSSLTLSVVDIPEKEGQKAQGKPLIQQDLIGAAYDVFLRGRYDGAGGLGTHLTPESVVDCMVKMAFVHVSDDQIWAQRGDLPTRARRSVIETEKDQPAFLVGDICCGTGRFLIRALAEVRQRLLRGTRGTDAEKAYWLNLMKRHSFFGADQSASSILKARLNFLMFGESHAQLLTVEDSILEPEIDRLAGQFDLILTNPPFGEGKYDAPAGLEKMRRVDLGLRLGWSWKVGDQSVKPLGRADPALLFLDRNLQLLKPGGLLLIVLPDGLLGPVYAYAHRYILEKAALRAVVSLPRDTFALSGTVAKTSFLCLQRRAPNVEPQPVFVALANHVGYLKKGLVQVPDPEGNDLPIIAQTYADLMATSLSDAAQEVADRPMMVLAPERELRDSLTAQSYHSDRLRAEQAVTGFTAGARALRDVVSLAPRDSSMRTAQTQYFISVLHVDERSNVDWDAAFSHTPTSKGMRCQPRDVLYSCLNPSKVRVAVVPDDIRGEILCSTEFAVLRPRADEDPYYIALALRLRTSQRQLIPLARGTSSSRQRVDERDLLDVMIPYSGAVSVRNSAAERFRQALQQAREADELNRAALCSLEETAGGG